MKIILKVLNRLRLLKLFNLITSISIGNKKFKIPLLQGIGITNINIKETWFTHLLTELEKKFVNIIFIDIGANIGQTLLQIKSLNQNWNYMGFEPNTNCQYYLKQLITNNSFKNITIYPVAISSSFELIHLYSNSVTDTTATTIEDFRPDHYAKGNKETVIGMDIDSLLNSKIDSNDNYIVKIDIEGSEYNALKGMTTFLNKSRALIICEVLDTHSNDTLDAHEKRLKNIELFLKVNNYRIFQIIRNENDTKFTSLKLIEQFEIKIWETSSLQLNDYLFVPIEKEQIIKEYQ